jgi:hypothetical protein
LVVRFDPSFSTVASPLIWIVLPGGTMVSKICESTSNGDCEPGSKPSPGEMDRACVVDTSVKFAKSEAGACGAIAGGLLILKK